MEIMDLLKESLFISFTALFLMYESALAFKSGCSEGYCFIVSDYTNGGEFLTQQSAQQWCSSNNSQLVEIVSKDIQNSLISVIQTLYPQGINSWPVITNGHRSFGNWIRLNGMNIGSISVKNQLDISYAYGYLTPLTPGFEIYASTPANTKNGYICSGVSECTGGATMNAKCYKSYSESLSWYDARDRCLDAGGDLASFDYITTNAGFNELNESWINPSYSYWVGFRREWWTWQSSSETVKLNLSQIFLPTTGSS